MEKVMHFLRHIFHDNGGNGDVDINQFVIFTAYLKVNKKGYVSAHILNIPQDGYHETI